MKNVEIVKRDRVLFEDIKRFGFTTVEHFSIKFNAKNTVAIKRFCKLVKSNYLKVVGRSEWSNRKYYMPDYRFFLLYPAKDIYKFNINNAEHDEYILLLFSFLENGNWSDEIEIEQDFKKKNMQNLLKRIPDIIVKNIKGNFIIEYERTLKSLEKYEEMYSALRRNSEHLNYFVFICENEKIARKIKNNFNFKYMSILKPKELLDALKAKKHKNLAQYFIDESVVYF